MKHYFILIGLFLTTTFSIAQEGVIVTMHAALVEGDLQAFEEVESKYMQKVAQHAAEKGDIIAWNLLKAVQLDGINDEQQYNYMFVQSNNTVEDILDPKNMFWNLADSILTKQEQADLAELQKKFTWTKDVHVVYRIDSGLWMTNNSSDYVGSAIQFNFAKPKNTTAFLEENATLWKPFFKENGTKMNMLSWGTAQKIHPTGDEWASVMTWDMFSSLADLFKYRLGDGINYPINQSNMEEINPDGFYQVATWYWLTGASAN
ncbi:MAG: hypothetical protein P8O93_05415 [Flavobacteriaceae bacterium]|nr:hypothetical protein [Flavobacteriaceae bacterium]MDG1961952.1 hypothetical protein [Flavobacteriaceae bacterium]